MSKLIKKEKSVNVRNIDEYTKTETID